MTYRKITLAVSTALMTVSLLGCAPKIVEKITPYQTTEQSLNRIAASLADAGITVVSQGERTWIIIPVDDFFEPQTTHLFIGQRQTIGRVARFILRSIQGPQTSVRVYGYTDSTFGKKTAKKLSAEYAHVIGSYLWNYGVSRHQMIIMGYGSNDAIASNLSDKGRAFNRRVMIEIN